LFIRKTPDDKNEKSIYLLLNPDSDIRNAFRMRTGSVCDHARGISHIDSFASPLADSHPDTDDHAGTHSDAGSRSARDPGDACP
jgi:hypothetical protein